MKCYDLFAYLIEMIDNVMSIFNGFNISIYLKGDTEEEKVQYLTMRFNKSWQRYDFIYLLDILKSLLVFLTTNSGYGRITGMDIADGIINIEGIIDSPFTISNVTLENFIRLLMYRINSFAIDTIVVKRVEHNEFTLNSVSIKMDGTEPGSTSANYIRYKIMREFSTHTVMDSIIKFISLDNATLTITV